jgi:hypothetical protein
MKQLHKHRDLIIAWANGEEIQIKRCDSTWADITYPTWDFNVEYRIKPEVIRYRLALFDYQNTEWKSIAITQVNELERIWELTPNFVKWLTDWTEVEV